MEDKKIIANLKDKISSLFFDTLGEEEIAILSIGIQKIGIYLNNLKEVINPIPLKRLPGLPEYILGMVIVMGRILPVIDLQRMLSIKKIGDVIKKYAIISNGEYEAVFTIDGYPDFLKIKADDMLKVDIPEKEGISKYSQFSIKLSDVILPLINIDELFNTIRSEIKGSI